MTLVEHALCPLESSRAFQQNLVHKTSYYFFDAARQRRLANAHVHCPLGLSPRDEFFLWGLLALSFAQPEPEVNFHATPHYCLKQLACITPQSKGGKSYRLFREAICRLAAVTYRNDRFYDPVRREHRDVCFGLFSFSLPLDPGSSRAWRIAWDPIFFEFCQSAGSSFSFNLELYRQLDVASRRLFLLLHKIFWRRSTSPTFDLRHLAVDVLGFSPNIDVRNLKVKVRRCAATLVKHGVLAATAGELFKKQAKGTYAVQFHRGAYFEERRGRSAPLARSTSPLHEPLLAIGFNDKAIHRLLVKFKPRDIQLWSDITLAALEKNGQSFFRRSPQAYFMDNIKNAGMGTRSPPDWWHAMRKEEETFQRQTQVELRSVVEQGELCSARAMVEQVLSDVFQKTTSVRDPQASDS